MILGFKRAKILSYDQATRTANVSIHGLTDGLENGIVATFAFPVGHDDRDTEIQIMDLVESNPDVYVFFEDGDESNPVISHFSSHKTGNLVDIRRIKQKNIELLATTNIKLNATTINITGSTEVNIVGSDSVNVTSDVKVSLKAPTVSINGA